MNEGSTTGRMRPIIVTEGGGELAVDDLRRVAIIGPCGAGKSTLARQLGTHLELPVFHLDRLYWKPGWVESEREEFRGRQLALVESAAWIVDGNYGSTFDLRMARADLVIYLDFPRRIYFRRVLWRSIRGLGRTRPDLTEGCPERLDLSFFRFTWNIPTQSRPRTLEGLARHNVAGRLVRLRSPRDVRHFIDALGPE